MDLEPDARQPLSHAPEPAPESAPPLPEHVTPTPRAHHAQPPPPRSARRQLISAALTGVSLAAAAGLLVIGPSSFIDGGLRRLVRLGRNDLVAVQEASGLYDTAGGRPIFFVRGRIENHGKRPGGPVRVVATLLSDSGPTARAEGVAGAEPTAEDVYALRSPAEADKLLKALAQRTADRRLPPGGSLPFFALFAEPPEKLVGQRVQLRLESAETAAAAR
jgi:hypothetical protein